MSQGHPGRSALPDPSADVYTEMIDALLAGREVPSIATVASRHLGQPVHVLLSGSEPGGELEGLRPFVQAWLSGADPSLPPGVSALVPVASSFERYGLVLTTEPIQAARATETDLLLRTTAAAALAGIAVQQARDEAEHVLSGSLLEEILTRRDFETKDLLRRADYLRCDLRDGAVGLCVRPGAEDPESLVRLVFAMRPGSLARVLNGLVYALLPGPPELSADLIERMRLRARTGASSYYPGPDHARNALEEAELMLEVAAAGENQAADETFRLLFRVLASHPEEMKRFSDSSIGPLIEHDKRYSSALVSTLSAYLHEHDCNMNMTARATYTHRHTVSNRLSRIRELTGLDPFRSEDRERLGLALKALQLVEQQRLSR
jgi:hypothetical protein